MRWDQSKQLYEEACSYIPGGVNSPVRAFQSVGMNPVFIEKGAGSRVWDVDHNEYIDYICSWGPLILGHHAQGVHEGVAEALSKGSSYGLPTAIEVEMAKLICEAVPSIDLVRMVNSGTEATMSALRVARGYTKRPKIMKFEGCYHGHGDGLLVKSGSGTLTYGVPTSAGVTVSTAQDTLVAGYNDIDSVKKLFEENPGEIAAVIVEPVAGNMGVVPPMEGFLQQLREITKKEGALLIFDEVITGFRLAYGGAQSVYGIDPDLTCLGKIIGGGLPVGAYGGKREIMEQVSPLGPVYQAGTLSGNPIAMKMGLNTIQYLKSHPEVYEEMEHKAQKLETGFKNNIEQTGIKATVNRIKGMLCIFFTDSAKGRALSDGDQAIMTYQEVMASDTKLYAKYFKEMLEKGILLPPAQFEGIFLSAAHSEEDIEYTIEKQLEVFKRVKENK